jgi:hypothetical protein
MDPHLPATFWQAGEPSSAPQRHSSCRTGSTDGSIAHDLGACLQASLVLSRYGAGVMRSLQAVLSLRQHCITVCTPSSTVQRSRRCLNQQWPDELRLHTRICSAVGVGGVAQPTTAAAAIFGGMARSLLRASPRQLFRSLSRLLIRAARPLLTGPGSVVSTTLCAIWSRKLPGTPSSCDVCLWVWHTAKHTRHNPSSTAPVS